MFCAWKKKLHLYKAINSTGNKKCAVIDIMSNESDFPIASPMVLELTFVLLNVNVNVYIVYMLTAKVWL